METETVSKMKKIHSVPVVTVTVCSVPTVKRTGQHGSGGGDYWAKSILGRVRPAPTTASV